MAHLRIIAPGQHSSIKRNVATVASHWQHCVRFDRPEISTSQLKPPAPEMNTLPLDQLAGAFEGKEIKLRILCCAFTG